MSADTNLSDLEVFPGGVTFGRAAEIMDTPEPAKPGPVKTPAQTLAEANVSRLGTIRSAAERTSGYYTAAEQDYIDSLVSGAESGVYSAEDVLSELDRLYSTRPSSETDGFGSDAGGDSKSLIQSWLAKYGLGSLAGTIDDIMARGIESESAVLFELRQTEAYQKRFAANAKRVAAGLVELTPATYVEMENLYRQIMKSNGMDRYFNRPDIIESLLSGDVSGQELQSRINEGYRRVQEADVATRTQMRELYGVEDADLAAYFLNPAETMPVLTRKAEAAKLAARAKEQGGIQLTATGAEALAARGISEASALETFGTMAQKRGIYEAMAGEQGLTLEEQLGAAFGYDPGAQKKLTERIATRRAQFEGGGSFARTTGATTGTTESSVGTAQ